MRRIRAGERALSTTLCPAAALAPKLLDTPTSIRYREHMVEQRAAPPRIAWVMMLVGGLLGAATMLFVDWSQWPSLRTALAVVMIAGYTVIAAAGAVGLVKSRR